MNVEQLSVNTIRVLSAEAIQKANSGHPGLPMGSAAMAYTLWARHMKHNPGDPQWADRDRFVLSGGHGSMLEYSLLHLFGYGLTKEDLMSFRQLNSKTPGHPEYGHTIGVETTTGPLGQGAATAVGFAMAEAYLAEKFNRPDFPVVDHYTYILSGDGCMEEGAAAEAASLAGTLKLGKLLWLYDSNKITIEGDTEIAFTEDVGKRFDAYGWQVQTVEDGNDIDAISAAIAAAKAVADKPSLIIVKTQIGFGCPAKQGKASAHGEPLGVDNLAATKENLGWTEEPFETPAAVKEHMAALKAAGAEKEAAWNKLFADYCAKYPELAAEWKVWFSKELPVDLANDESYWAFDGKAASRDSSGEVIQRLAAVIPNLIGGSADLAPSNKTRMKARGDFGPNDRTGSNLHFGVREFAMTAILSGMYLHGGLRPYGATFFVFSDYMKPAMRLASLMGLPITYVLTHDSIGVGEDGPTHEPIEHLTMLRSLPNFHTFRPADSKEVAAGWLSSLTSERTPTALVLTRQKLPLYAETGKEALKGGYILVDSKKEIPDIILMASGSEVEYIYEARKVLEEKGIDARVVSMPCTELFDEQCPCYKEKVLPAAVRARVAVEAGATLGWYKYVGLDGKVVGIDTFGASAPAATLFKLYGMTTENVVAAALEVLGK